VDSDLFRDPEAGRPGAGVGGLFVFGGPRRTAGDDAKGGPVVAGADWLLGWADAVFGLDVEVRLDQAVFQGLEGDRRHTTTGFECRKSCSESCLDLSELVVDRDPDALKGPRRDVDVARPGRARDGGFDGLREVAGGAERAPRHDELCDPAGPTFFAVPPQDALELGPVVRVYDLGRGELGGWVHPHVERPFGAKAESARRVVELRAGQTEVEEDEVRRLEAVVSRDRAKLREGSVNRDGRGAEVSQRSPCGLDRRGIAIDPQQPPAGRDPLQDLAGMARLPERGVDRDRPRPGLEQLYYLL